VDALAAKRARLAAVERELTRLRYRHDIAMSAFRFEEATALGLTIAALEQERQTLVAKLPADRELPTGVVPVLMDRGRPARMRPRRSRSKIP
jgi:hypothetical protein